MLTETGRYSISWKQIKKIDEYITLTFHGSSHEHRGHCGVFLAAKLCHRYVILV